MSWSLRLHNGDFVLNGAQLGTVTDENKLTQDFRCALLEHMGLDDMHPEFGSLIDGGRTPDGTVIPGVIGQPDVRTAAATIQSEIQRIGRSYQNQQLHRAKDDRVTYNRVSLSAAEVLLNVTNITIVQQQDTLLVTVYLQTARGQDLTVTFPLLTTG